MPLQHPDNRPHYTFIYSCPSGCYTPMRNAVEPQNTESAAPYCPQRFSRKDPCERPIKKKHADLSKTFHCKECKKTFQYDEARCSLFLSTASSLLAMGTRSTRSSTKKSSSFLLPEEIDNLSALLENPDSLYNPDPQNTGAIPKKKSTKKTSSSHTDDPSASVENLIHLEVLQKETLATQLQITETKLKLAQLNANVLSPASDAVAATPPFSLTKLRSAIAPNASSSPSLPSEFAEIPSLDQLRSRKKAGASLPNNFLFSPKGTVDYDKLELAEFVCGYLEFCKEQPESSKAPLLKHLHLLMERAITYSWSSVRNFHLSVNNAIEQGHLSWQSYESIRERGQTFFTHQDLRSNLPTSSHNGSIPACGKAKDLLCREWNYTGKCSCAISDASYKAVHRCRVCDSPDHAMLTCAKRKYPIPASQSASSSTSSSTGADQSS